MPYHNCSLDRSVGHREPCHPADPSKAFECMCCTCNQRHNAHAHTGNARCGQLFRYNIAADMVEGLLPDLRSAAASAPESLTWPLPSGYDASHGAAAQGVGAMSGLVAVTVWLRFSSLRLLTWNHNYNVKPREISAALDRLGANLVQVSHADCVGCKLGMCAGGAHWHLRHKAAAPCCFISQRFRCWT